MKPILLLLALLIVGRAQAFVATPSPPDVQQAPEFADVGWQSYWQIQYDLAPPSVGNLEYVGYYYGLADGLVAMFPGVIALPTWQGYEPYSLPWGSFPYGVGSASSYYALAQFYDYMAQLYVFIPAASQEYAYAAGYYEGVGDALTYGVD